MMSSCSDGPATASGTGSLGGGGGGCCFDGGGGSGYLRTVWKSCGSGLFGFRLEPRLWRFSSEDMYSIKRLRDAIAGGGEVK